MGRKRKTRAPMKIAHSPSKQVKLEESHDSSLDPLAVGEASPCPSEQDIKVFAQPAVLSNPDRKPWVEKCRRWVDEQQQVAEPPPDDGDDEPAMDEPAEPSSLGADLPLRQMLKDYSEKEILNSVMYECEWNKCDFETIEDLKYMTHVETHVYQYLAEPRDDEDLICFWDLCKFRTSDPTELESHVHFHVYHNRVKTHGASLSSIIQSLKCNGDSRRRNCIDSFKTSFRCEWADCDEAFNKVYLFFQHVSSHVQDQFPVDRKSTKHSLQCQWDGCKQLYTRRSIALEHMRRHTTERTIGCYTCGAIFVSRLKYIDHCKRQVEYHNREFACPDCNKLFATKQLMIDHRNIHDKKHFCSVCPMRFPSKKALATHIRYRHVAEKPLKCSLCDHRDISKRDLNEHFEARHNPNRKLHVCSVLDCKVSYKSSRALRNHLKNVHSPKSDVYSCHWCDKTYLEGAKLSCHLENIHRCRKQPGQIRFFYRIDASDGCYRLDSFLDDEFAGVPAERKPNKSDGPRKKQEVPVATPWVRHSINSYRVEKGNVLINIVPDKLMTGP